jgi:ribosomal protein S18 acetylase RimI-like enzyme
MTIPAVRISRTPSALIWYAFDSDVVAGEVSGRLRPDGRCFVYFDVWRPDVYPPLADAVAQGLRCDLYASLDDADFDAIDGCAAAGFVEHRRESYYRIPTDPAVTGLADTAMPDGMDLVSAADADVDQLRLLDDALRQDLPGCDGWHWDPGEFREDTFGPFFDPATYLVAVDRSGGEYAGLVRVWRSRGGPRLSLIATLPEYRKRGVARALLGRTFAVLVARGETSVIAEADDANGASLAMLTRLGARRFGGSVELIRRYPTIDLAE